MGKPVFFPELNQIVLGVSPKAFFVRLDELIFPAALWPLVFSFQIWLPIRICRKFSFNTPFIFRVAAWFGRRHIGFLVVSFVFGDMAVFAFQIIFVVGGEL